MSGDIIVGAAKTARDWMDWATFIITGVGVIVVVIYTGVAWWQAILTRRALAAAGQSSTMALEQTRTSNQIAKDALVLGRRSWLVVSRLRAPNTFVPDEPWEFHIMVKNCGGVPATSVACRYSVLLVESSMPLPEAEEIAVNLFQTPAIGVAAMAPGKAHVTGMGQGLNFAKDRVEQIASGAVKMYLYWHFSYRDALLDQSEPNRWSSGCWRYWSDRGSWIVAEKHNEAP